MFMKNALFSGITGRDGSFLSEFLMIKNYGVQGILIRSLQFI